MENLSLEGASVIVTGGSCGYGEGIAKVFKDRGAKVWITARDAERLEATARKLGVNAITADVTSEADWDRVFKQVMGETSKVDVLINNAGTGVRFSPLDEQSDSDLRKTIDINLTGAMFGCQRAAKVMKKQKSGTIVNIASGCSQLSRPNVAAYTGAKAGLVHMTESLYLELREHGARASTVIPYWGATNFASAMNLPGQSPEVAARCIQPQDIGDLVAYVCELPKHLVIQEVTLLPTVQPLEAL